MSKKQQTEQRTVPEAKIINKEIKEYIINDIQENVQTFKKVSDDEWLGDLADNTMIKIYTTKDSYTGIILRFSAVEKLKIQDLTYIRIIYDDYPLDEFIRDRSIMTGKQPTFCEKYNTFKNRSETLKRIKDKEDKAAGKVQPKKQEKEDKMDKKLKMLYKYAEYMTKKGENQTFKEFAGDEEEEEPEPLTIEELSLKFSEYDRLPALPPEGIFKRVQKIKNIEFDNLFIINDELYRETKGTTGKDAFKKMSSKTNQKGEKVFRVAYTDNNKEKSITFNMTRFKGGQKYDITTD